MKSPLSPRPLDPAPRAGFRRVRFLGSLPLLLVLVAAGCGEAPQSPQDQERLRQREHNLVIDDAAVVITSGTTTLRSVRATRAIFHEDTRFLEASSVTLTLRLPEQKVDATIHASRGEVFLASQKPSEETFQEKATSGLKSLIADHGPVGFEAMKTLTYLPEDEHPFGDVVLYGPVTGHTSDGGEFETQTVLWSEQRKRLMVPHPFRQKIALPKGQFLSITGSGFEADSTLQEWVYYGDTEQVEMKVRPGELGGDSPKDLPTPAPPNPPGARAAPAG